MLNKEKLFQNFIEQEELMNDKVQNGIEAHRKGYFKINLTDGEGNLVRGAKVSVRQKTLLSNFGRADK